MFNIHATLISFHNKGILLTGKSGVGKSDVALRMIMEKGAVLVADDRVDLVCANGNLFGSCPKNIRGLLEVRNVGIGHFVKIRKTWKDYRIMNMLIFWGYPSQN